MWVRLITTVLIVAGAGGWLLWTQTARPPAAPASAAASEPLVGQTPSYVEDEPAPSFVFDVQAHSREEVESLLQRAEAIAKRPRPGNAPASVALVLHGPEVEFFAIKNYEQNRAIVDLAARLDAFNLIDVKICQTQMRARGLRAEDVPAFVDIVPYGPAEVERLKRNGFTYL